MSANNLFCHSFGAPVTGSFANIAALVPSSRAASRRPRRPWHWLVRAKILKRTHPTDHFHGRGGLYFMRLGIAAALISAFFLPAARAADWLPVDPADLALKTSKVEKDADAEVMFWDIHIDDDPPGLRFGTAWTHYMRIKIFTDRGRESQSTVTLSAYSFRGATSFSDIAGRTIRPDGTILELKSDAVFDRVLGEAGGLKLQSKSFALPGVEVGSIIEFRWREMRLLRDYKRLYFQLDIPIREVRYHIKPYPGAPMRYQPFQLQHTAFNWEHGFYTASASNIPAFHAEPMMPPEDELISWMLIYYTADRKFQPDEYWKALGKEAYMLMFPLVKPSDAIKNAAQTIIGDASTPDKKLMRLVNYCRTSIQKITDETADLTAEQRASAKRNKSPGETLKQGIGTGEDVNLLFASLAMAAGFDVHLAMASDRSDKFFDKNFLDPYFLPAFNIAVRVGDNWQFFDPAFRFVTPGMLRWQLEGSAALLLDPKEPRLVETPMSGPEKSIIRRAAKLRLSNDGTLEGDVELAYTGHSGAAEKNALAADSLEKTIERLTKAIKDRLGTAEVSSVKIENLTDPLNPLRYSYHVKVPGYAERAGRRLLLQPAYFQRSLPAVFPGSTRIHPIYFKYPWSEEDEVTIETPAGFALDHAEAPVSLKMGEAGDYTVQLGVAADGRTLVYQRKFVIGKKNMIFFPADSYQQLKKVFDFVHQQDDHAVLLRAEAAQ